MKYNPKIHHRRSIRLPEYDYTQPGAYFITINTYQHNCIFGQVTNDQMVLNAFGQVVDTCWHNIPNHFDNVELDAFIIMPNHVHGIINITESNHFQNKVRVTHASLRQNTFVRAMHASPQQIIVRASHATPQHGPKPKSLGTIVGSFKSTCTKHINRQRKTLCNPIWQRNYYEHIIRNEKALNQIREYIIHNALKWESDRYYIKNKVPCKLISNNVTFSVPLSSKNQHREQLQSP